MEIERLKKKITEDGNEWAKKDENSWNVLDFILPGGSKIWIYLCFKDIKKRSSLYAFDLVLPASMMSNKDAEGLRCMLWKYFGHSAVWEISARSVFLNDFEAILMVENLNFLNVYADLEMQYFNDQNDECYSNLAGEIELRNGEPVMKFPCPEENSALWDATLKENYEVRPVGWKSAGSDGVEFYVYQVLEDKNLSIEEALRTEDKYNYFGSLRVSALEDTRRIGYFAQPRFFNLLQPYYAKSASKMLKSQGVSATDAAEIYDRAEAWWKPKTPVLKCVASILRNWRLHERPLHAANAWTLRHWRLVEDASLEHDRS